jgi:predicted translin family RNA/ssDNA-binding protein
MQDIENCRQGWANLVQIYYPEKTDCQVLNSDEILRIWENEVNTKNQNTFKKEYYENNTDKKGENFIVTKAFDVIDICYIFGLPFDIGNVLKYVIRAGKKDKSKEIEDLKKAAEYLNRKIQQLEHESKIS